MTSLHIKPLLSAVVLASLLGGCDAKQESTSAADTSADTSVAEASVTDAKPAGDGAIGVKECDDYIKAYEACLDKMPEAARDSMKQGLDAAVAAWKSADASAKDELAAACKTAYDSSAPSMQSMGCDW